MKAQAYEKPTLADGDARPLAQERPAATGPERFSPLAGLAGLVLPGLGHVVLGQPRRGLAVMAGVLGLFFGGLLLGGLDTVDSREDRLWFYVHALAGPVAFGADWANQHLLKAWAMDVSPAGRPVAVYRSAYPGEVRVTGPQDGRLPWPTLRQLPQWGSAQAFDGPAGAGKSVGKVNEVAMLMCALAGMMNLVAVLDAAFNRRLPERMLRREARA
ncbi:MAG: hypothetical protein KatS3mg103_0839 [Phycisphaerales bacterium]|nr:MAG: hypothetical protein KatS3mg103_0839 [Phycisphaerales bacterium]